MNLMGWEISAFLVLLVTVAMPVIVIGVIVRAMQTIRQLRNTQTDMQSRLETLEKALHS